MPTAYFGTIPYTVQPGDTLTSIAHAYNTTVSNIMRFNNLTDPNLIYAGQKLKVPMSPPEAVIHTVRAGETLYRISRAYGTTLSNLIKYNYLQPPYVIYPGQQLVVTASLR